VPTYQYTCTECGEPVEVVQKFTDEPLTVCAVCGGRLRKVFSPVGIVFKGSGFYRTDSRKGSSVVSADKPDKPDKQSSEAGASASSSNGSDSASGKESKPAAKKPGETVTTPSKSSSSSEKVA
jgi:putative FmdB family regulatory protein